MNSKDQGRSPAQVSRAAPAAAVLFAALLLAVLLPLRLWQQLHLVEQGTGFWANGDITVPLLYAGLAVLAAAPIAAAFVLRRRAALDLTRKRRVIEGVTAALAAAALVADAVIAFSHALELFSGMGGEGFLDGLENQNSSLLAKYITYYIRSGAMACVLESVFGLLGAVFFGQLAAVDFLPQKKTYIGRALALAPFAWAVCRILRCFARTIAYLRVSDLFLGLAMLVALMLFLLALAQCVSGRYGGSKAAVLAAAGIPAAVLALLCFVPRLVTYDILGHTRPQDAMTEWCDPAMALFALAFVAGRLFTCPAGQTQAEDAPAEEMDGEPEEEQAEEPDGGKQ